MGMQIKKFQASTLQKAIEQVRSELGDGAVILQTETVKSEGMFGGNMIEVTAGLDRKDTLPRFEATVTNEEEERNFISSAPKKKKKTWRNLFGASQKSDKPNRNEVKSQIENATYSEHNRTPSKTPTNDDSTSSMGQWYAMKTFVEPLQKEVESLKNSLREPPKSSRQPSASYIETEIQSLKSTLFDFMNQNRYADSDLPEHYQRLVNFWREKGMSERQIYSFLRRIENKGVSFDRSGSHDIKALLKEEISASHTIESPKQRIVVLVGPTGVGKTTTIAKLAAYERLKLSRNVAMLTVDDYKIGGTDQLNHYARILEVPFAKPRSDLTLEEMCKDHSADTIFVDTFGISPMDDRKIADLRKALRFKDPLLSQKIEVHLVLPVGIPQTDVEGYLSGFSRINPNYLLFTKWDETDNWGGMLGTILSSGCPVSFISHGQEVPDDLAVFSEERFIETVLGTNN